MRNSQGLSSSFLFVSIVACSTGCVSEQDHGTHPAVPDGGPREDSNLQTPEVQDCEHYALCGQVEPFDANAFSFGSPAGFGSVTIGVTSIEGALGCGLAASEHGIPASDGARVLARFAGHGVCPTGSYVIERCSGLYFSQSEPLAESCAAYERWGDGFSVARDLATGGGAVVSSETLAGGTQRCTVQLQLQFDNQPFSQQFTFDYSADSDAPICVTGG